MEIACDKILANFPVTTPADSDASNIENAFLHPKEQHQTFRKFQRYGLIPCCECRCVHWHKTMIYSHAAINLDGQRIIDNQ